MTWDEVKTFAGIMAVIATPLVGWIVSVERRISALTGLEKKVDKLDEKLDRQDEKLDRLVDHMLDEGR